MDTTEIIKKHEGSFNKIRRMLQVLLVLVIAVIIFIQYKNIASFFKWISE